MRIMHTPTPHTLRAGSKERQRGSAMVEFAIVSPVAVLLVMAIIQLGLTFSAKELINEAAFVAARAGAVQHAQVGVMTPVMFRSLIPLYQDTTKTDPAGRLQDALQKATNDAGCGDVPCVQVQVMNPTKAAFDDFGTTNAVSGNQVFIPNDNLEFRTHGLGGESRLSIEDANVLKIKVIYGYPIKVPFMQTVIKSAMCGVINDPDCDNFYSQGRIPIVAYATVQMQTPAWKSD